MIERTLADILEEIAAKEVILNAMTSDLNQLRTAARNHPQAAAGRDLPPIIGTIGA